MSSVSYDWPGLGTLKTFQKCHAKRKPSFRRNENVVNHLIQLNSNVIPSVNDAMQLCDFM